MVTVAAEIAGWLHEKGIEAAFGIIGGGNCTLWDALARMGKIQIVCVHHEQAAAMASGYFNRIRGRLGSVVLVTTGAGSSNAVTGVLAAHMDRTPLLVISGNEASKYMGGPERVWGVQGYDSARVACGFAKRGYRIKQEGSTRAVLETAYDYATCAPHGPVWVDLPKDLQGAALG